jgi:hypothetical protein
LTGSLDALAEGSAMAHRADGVEEIVRGSPRSIVLTWANSVAGWWTSAAVAVIQRQQKAVLDAMLPKGPRKGRRRKRR